jgi:hypothetical protein
MNPRLPSRLQRWGTIHEPQRLSRGFHRLALLFVFLAASSSARSQDMVMFGAGLSSCERWTEHQQIHKADPSDPQWLLDSQWIFGFVTGSNYSTSQNQARFADATAIMAYIDNYCALSPLHTLGMAAAALVQEGGGVRAAHEWKH